MIVTFLLVGSCVVAAFLYWAPRRDQIKRAERQATRLRRQLATARRQRDTAQRERTAAQAQAVHACDQLGAARQHIQDLELEGFRAGVEVEHLRGELVAVYQQLAQLVEALPPEAGR